MTRKLLKFVNFEMQPLFIKGENDNIVEYMSTILISVGVNVAKELPLKIGSQFYHHYCALKNFSCVSYTTS